jgi:L-ascorbate metabolism protein UlaG (beta-lactamase superfamily)
MNIKFHGHACFSIETDGGTIVTDPFSNEIGLKMPALKADVITVSHNDAPYNNREAIPGEPRVFSWAGEYETCGIHFKGIHSFHNTKDDKEQLENVVFLINDHGIKLCHLGAQGTKLTPEQLEQIGDVDVLFVPVGGKGTVDAKKAKEIVEQIEPRVIIPMAYHTEGSKLGLGTLAAFLDVMGAKSTEPVDTFKVKKSELPEDNSKVVIINASW